MNIAEWIALFTCFATYLYVGLVALTLYYIYIQTEEFKKNRKLQAAITIFRELQAKETRNARKYIYTQVPIDIKGTEDKTLQQHLENSEEALVAYDRLGYLISEGYIDYDPIINTHWPAVWKCWKKSKSLILWAREKRSELTYLKQLQNLFEICESYRKENRYRKPKIY